jgi:hypothetical protein
MAKSEMKEWPEKEKIINFLNNYNKKQQIYANKILIKF